MILKIRNRKTGKEENLIRGFYTHPAWVHEQCGTSSESELQELLEQIDQDTFAYNPERENEAGIFVSLASAHAHLVGLVSLADISSGHKRWLRQAQVGANWNPRQLDEPHTMTEPTAEQMREDIERNLARLPVGALEEVYGYTQGMMTHAAWRFPEADETYIPIPSINFRNGFVNHLWWLRVEDELLNVLVPVGGEFSIGAIRKLMDEFLART